MKITIDTQNEDIFDILKTVDRLNYWWKYPNNSDIPELDERDVLRAITMLDLVTDELSGVLSFPDPVKHNEFQSAKFEEALKRLKYVQDTLEKLKSINRALLTQF